MHLEPLSPKQRATIRLSLEPDARISVWDGAVSSGKTICSLIAWAQFVAEAPEGAALIMVGKTFSTLRRNVIEPLTQLLGEENVVATYGSGTARILGKQVFLLGADNSSAEGKLRGISAYGIYLDELTLLGGPNAREFWEMVRTRMRVRGAKIFASTNPGASTSWLLTEYLERAEVVVAREGTVSRNPEAPEGVGLRRFCFVLDDNAHVLDPSYIASLKSSYAGVFYDRFIEGRWVAATGAVYAFDLKPGGEHVEHVSPATLRAVTRWTVGIDWGVTNPTAAVLVGVTADNRIVVASELRIEDQAITVAEQVSRVARWITEGAGGVLPFGTSPDSVSVVVDPSAKAFRNEWRAAGYRWPTPANNAVLEGISDVSSLVASGRMVFSDALIGSALFREISGYVWDERATDRGQDAVVKADDHSVDAMRYAVRNLQPTYRRWLEVPKPAKQPLDRALQPY